MNFLGAWHGVRVLMMPLVLACRRLLIRCADLLVPPELTLYETSSGVAQTQILAQFVALGLPELLQDGPQMLDVLCRETGLPEPMLARFLNATLALDLTRRQRDGRYRATARGRALQSGRRGNMAAFATYMASASNVAAWGNLKQVLRTGEDGFKYTHGQDVWSYFEDHAAERQIFAQAMTSLSQIEGHAVADAYPFGRHATLCDVGGSSGALLMTLLRVHKQCSGIVLDRASLTEPARAALPEMWRERLRYCSGDFFQAVPQGCDAYVLRHILHDWDDAACGVILTRCREAMGPQARLLIVDSRVEPHSGAFLGAFKDLTMAVICGGQERSRAAMQALLTASGLRLVRIWPTASAVVVWEAALGFPE